MLKDFCLSSMGSQRVDEMAFSSDSMLLNKAHQQIGEFARIIEEEDGFPDSGFYDLRPTLHRLRIEGTFIEVDEMHQLKRALETLDGVVGFLHRREDDGDGLP